MSEEKTHPRDQAARNHVANPCPPPHPEHSRYAFLALGIPYTPAPRWLSLLGGTLTPQSSVFCGSAMLQYGLDAPDDPGQVPGRSHPPPLFVHANLIKHQTGARPASGTAFSLVRRLSPLQDDVRAEYATAAAAPLDGVAGGAKEVGGRGLCSDIVAFRDGVDVETVDAAGVYGGVLDGFEEVYFGYPGTRPGVWR